MDVGLVLQAQRAGGDRCPVRLDRIRGVALRARRGAERGGLPDPEAGVDRPDLAVRDREVLHAGQVERVHMHTVDHDVLDDRARIAAQPALEDVEVEARAADRDVPGARVEREHGVGELDRVGRGAGRAHVGRRGRVRDIRACPVVDRSGLVETRGRPGSCRRAGRWRRPGRTTRTVTRSACRSSRCPRAKGRPGNPKRARAAAARAAAVRAAAARAAAGGCCGAGCCGAGGCGVSVEGDAVVVLVEPAPAPLPYAASAVTPAPFGAVEWWSVGWLPDSS